MSMPLEFQYDVHKDCTPCSNHEGEGRSCDLIGTGAHEPIDQHLMRVHGYSQDKMDGMRIAARVLGKDEIEVFVLAHMGILMFQPRTHDA